MPSLGEVRVLLSSPDAPARAAWTSGLQAAGQAEIALALAWAHDPERDDYAMRILEYIVDYLRASGRRILAGETMACAWSTLRFEASPTPGGPVGALAIHEMADRFGDRSRGFVPGASMTIDVCLAQDAALRRTGLAEDGPRPHCDELAVVCDQVSGRALGEAALHAERFPPSEDGQSTWIVGRTDCEHDHDDAQSFAPAHLKHLAAEFPVLLAYFSAPAGTTLMVYADRVVVFPPGEQSGRLDPAPPFPGR